MFAVSVCTVNPEPVKRVVSSPLLDLNHTSVKLVSLPEYAKIPLYMPADDRLADTKVETVPSDCCIETGVPPSVVKNLIIILDAVLGMSDKLPLNRL